MRHITLTAGFFLPRTPGHRHFRHSTKAPSKRAFISILLFLTGSLVLTVLISSCSLISDTLSDSKSIAVKIPDKGGSLIWLKADASVGCETVTSPEACRGESPEDTGEGGQASSEGGQEFLKVRTRQACKERIMSITVAKALLTPVLFYGDGEQQPWGFIYPLEEELSEAGGFAAHILYRFIKESEQMEGKEGDKREVRLFASHFNWRKLQELVKKAQDQSGNPWEWDQTHILQAIAQGTFKADTVKVP
ncbi:MAG: hypothetical protein K5930_05690 [Treponemataceae bacterium]|nr:hypothetical protein [Treponemataceae bacterium]